jgi:hypothetical protein
MTASESNVIMLHKINSGNVNPLLTFNSDSGSNYAWRYNNNGGTDATVVNGTKLEMAVTGTTPTLFNIFYSVNVSTEEKLLIGHTVEQNTAGAGTAPQRMEVVSKWANTSDQITTVSFGNDAAGDYAIDSNVSVIGSDLTPAAAITFPTNVQVGSRAEITDTRKMYNYSERTKTVDENFDSTGLLTWTDSDSAKITVDSSTNERLDFTFVRDSTTDETHHDLGSALSNTAWVMDFDLTLSTVNQGGGTDGNLGYIGIFSATGQGTQDGMHLQIISRSDYTRFRATATYNSSMLSEAISEGTAFTTVTPSVTTYYVRIIRDGNDCTVEFYSSADRTGTPTESQTETQVSITGLQYISVRNLNFSAGNSSNNNLVGYIDNLKVYDGVTDTSNYWQEIGA